MDDGFINVVKLYFHNYIFYGKEKFFVKRKKFDDVLCTWTSVTFFYVTIQPRSDATKERGSYFIIRKESFEYQ